MNNNAIPTLRHLVVTLENHDDDATATAVELVEEALNDGFTIGGVVTKVDPQPFPNVRAEAAPHAGASLRVAGQVVACSPEQLRGLAAHLLAVADEVGRA